MPAAFPKTTFSIFMPVTLQDLGWNDHFQRAFNAVAKPGWVPGRLIRETKINFTALLDGGEDVDAVVSGKLWHDAATDAELPAVGDWVAIDPGEAPFSPARPVFPAKLREKAARNRFWEPMWTP